MDCILFYGDRDDASRRQVRSAAAQHSHRIGPRKPKSSKQPRSQPPSTKKRPLKANPIIALGPADIAAKNRPASTSDASPRESSARATAPLPPKPSPSSKPTPEKGARRPQQTTQLRWKQVQGIDQPHTSPRPLSEVPRHPGPTAPAPLPPPLVIERIPPASSTGSHSRQSSVASPASPTTRLPQYSWTEYPRYGMHHGRQTSLQMLAHAAVPDQESTRQTSVPAPGTAAPTSSASPALSSLQAPAFRPVAPESGMMGTRQLPEPRPASHAVDSSFGAFLRTMANGQDRYLDDPYQRRSSSGSERHGVEIKREAPPDG